MSAFAVKHIAGDLGPLSKIMKQVKKAPYSYASNEPEATNAALGNDIYVFEVRAEPKGLCSYWLGYKFKAFEKYPPAGGGKWLERFKFKNAARPCEQAEGSEPSQGVCLAASFPATTEGVTTPRRRAGPNGTAAVARAAHSRPAHRWPFRRAARQSGDGSAPRNGPGGRSRSGLPRRPP
jgi:hypothetical protein